MRFPRMTTRRWMIAVAFAASFLAAGVTLHRRSTYLQALADYHESRSEIEFFALDSSPQKHAVAVPAPILVLDGVEFYNARANRHVHLAAKHRRAARYPWLPVEPDLPEPE